MGITFGVSELPKIKIGSNMFYIDVRLGELRNINNPHDVRHESKELLEYWVSHNIKEL